MSKNTKNTGSIRDQLSKSKGALLTASSPVSHPSRWKEDGVDHINVSMAANTRLGEWLNGRNCFPFRHPILGQFRSIDNLSMFIRAAVFDDRIRTEPSFGKIRNLILKNGGWRQSTPYYKAVVVHSIYIRVLMNEALMKLMIENDLPFDSYSVNHETGLRQRFEPAIYLCSGYNEIRKALRERRPVNLRPFIEGPIERDVDIYKDLMAELAPDYQADLQALIKRFEEHRWDAYDAWVVRGEQMAEAKRLAEERKLAAEKAAEERRLKKEQEKKAKAFKETMMDLGGVSRKVIESIEAPKKRPYGTLWFKSDENAVYVYCLVTKGPEWISYSSLMEDYHLNEVAGRVITANFSLITESVTLTDECWMNGWSLYNPIKRESLYPVKETAEAPVTWTTERPERLKKAKEDGRSIPTAEVIEELRSVTQPFIDDLANETGPAEVHADAVEESVEVEAVVNAAEGEVEEVRFVDPKPIKLEYAAQPLAEEESAAENESFVLANSALSQLQGDVPPGIAP